MGRTLDIYSGAHFDSTPQPNLHISIQRFIHSNGQMNTLTTFFKVGRSWVGADRTFCKILGGFLWSAKYMCEKSPTKHGPANTINDNNEIGKSLAIALSMLYRSVERRVPTLQFSAVNDNFEISCRFWKIMKLQNPPKILQNVRSGSNRDI